MRFGDNTMRKLIFLAFIVKQMYIMVERMSQTDRRCPFHFTLNPLMADFFLAFVQILGLVFSMTMFCQSVKVETFYA